MLNPVIRAAYKVEADYPIVKPSRIEVIMAALQELFECVLFSIRDSSV
jgi:hypothetical protein